MNFIRSFNFYFIKFDHYIVRVNLRIQMVHSSLKPACKSFQDTYIPLHIYVYILYIDMCDWFCFTYVLVVWFPKFLKCALSVSERIQFALVILLQYVRYSYQVPEENRSCMYERRETEQAS